MKIKINNNKRFYSVEFDDKTRRISFLRNNHKNELYSGYSTCISDTAKYERCKERILKKNMKDLQAIIVKVLDMCYPGLGSEENVIGKIYETK